MTVEDLALNGGTPAKRTPFPAWPAYDEREIEAVTDVIESRQWWRGNGTQLVSFEQEFAVRCAAAETMSAEGVWLHHRMLLGDEHDLVELVDAIKKIQVYTQQVVSVA